MNAADRRRLTPVLALAAIALAAVLIALWAGLGRGVRWSGRATAAAPPPGGSITAAPAVPAAAQFAAIWQKPLFSPTRSPEAVAGDAGEANGDLQLTGVILLPGLRMAILHDRAADKDYRVIEGQPGAPGAPRLVALQPRSAVVEASGARLELRLVPAAPGGGAAADAAGEDTGGSAAAPPAAATDASAMVTRRAAPEGAPAGTPVVGEAQLNARARALKARIEAQRREMQRKNGG